MDRQAKQIVPEVSQGRRPWRRPRGELDTAPQRILLTRLSAIGDCLASVPLAVDIKRLWPTSHLTWIVDCGAAALIEKHPAVDSVIRISKKWMKQTQLWRELRQQLQAANFDLALDPQGLTKSAMLGWLSGARLRIGFDRSHAREIAPWLYNMRITRQHRHMVDTYRQLLAPWRDTLRDAGQFNMPNYAEEDQRVLHDLEHLQLKQPWVCINVGAGWPTKIWPPSRFAEVGQALFKQRGLKSLVVWSGDTERCAAEQIVHALGPAGVLAPPTTLRELAQWLRRAEIVISSDTGPAHLAAAVGTPSVVLFGPTWGDECGPYGADHRVVQSIVMPPRGAPRRRGVAVAMNAIQVDEVVDACLDVLTRVHAVRVSA